MAEHSQNGYKKNEIVKYIPQEVDEFEERIRKFRAGEMTPEEFMAYRLVRGTYGQRQLDAQMLRVKIPGGTLTPEQLDALGEIARRFAPLKKGHFTTRENMQFHHVLLEHVPEALRILGPVGLTTREACGNTLRNVVTCPMAGVCPDEVFDVTPYLVAYVRYFVRQPLTQKLPRKFKTAFSGSANDCAIVPIHDLGFIPVMKRENGVEKKGFKMVVGGGLSIMPKIAPTLYEFVPVEEYLKVSEAVLRVFNKSDELRKNKMMARVKVLIHRVGIDKFREMVEEELKGDWAKKSFDPTPHMALEDEEDDAPPVSAVAGYTNGPLPPQYLLWKAANTRPQKQEGYYAVTVKLPLGDVQAEQFPALANIVRKYASRARVTQQQNLMIRWVPEQALPLVWTELSAVDLVEEGPNEITDVVACPSTDSCKLGITAAMGLGRVLRETLLGMGIDDPLIKGLHIHVSGCPNACAQHHIGNIGFHGASIKVGTNQVPAYEMFVGGSRDPGDTRIGLRVPVKVPAKRVPEYVKRILEYYKQNRQNGEAFNQFVDRVGIKPFEAIAAPLKELGPLGPDTIEYYMDWERTTLYKVERGEGECSV